MPPAGLAQTDSSFVRLWQGLMSTRIGVAALLLAAQIWSSHTDTAQTRWALGMCGAYLAATLATRLLARPRGPGAAFDAQWLPVIGADVLMFATLRLASFSSLDYTALLGLPVLIASVLGSLRLALGTAASITLLLLAQVVWQGLTLGLQWQTPLLQSGMGGLGLFLLALTVHQLSARLAREEENARRSQATAQEQLEVNALVIETLADGVLVVDAAGQVHAINPAAARLLGADPTLPCASLHEQSRWQPLAAMVQRAFETQQEQTGELRLSLASGALQPLQISARTSALAHQPAGGLCVVFLRDLREVQARVRTEKLAAMGRMSAAVAHEIRNPLTAIVQANSLLEEDLHNPQLRQLTQLIRNHTQRLGRIVDDVLNFSGAHDDPAAASEQTLELHERAGAIGRQWQAQTGCGEQLGLDVAHAPLWVRFSDDHLQRLMVNLLDNALRYAQAGAHPNHAIQLSTAPSAEAPALLRVWSRGPHMEGSVQAHVFEPFFSSNSRSTGLGLYICRELCLRHGASIGYRRSTREGIEGNEFFVQFQMQTQTQTPTQAQTKNSGADKPQGAPA